MGWLGLYQMDAGIIMGFKRNIPAMYIILR
jgi:hypothetical protein